MVFGLVPPSTPTTSIPSGGQQPNWDNMNVFIFVLLFSVVDIIGQCFFRLQKMDFLGIRTLIVYWLYV